MGDTAKISELRDLLSMMHDGELYEMEKDGNDFIIKIENDYVARHVDHFHNTIIVRLLQVKQMYFSPWSEKEKKLDAGTVVKWDHEISYAELENGMIKVGMISYPEEDFYPGGDLWIECTGYEMYCQDMLPLSFRTIREKISKS